MEETSSVVPEIPPQYKRKSKAMQIFLAVITNFSCVAPGITLGFSAVLLPVLLKEGNEQITVEQGSWIASSASISMPIGCLIAAPILDFLGRKIALTIVNIINIIGWIIIATASTDPYWMFIMLIIGRILTGVANGIGSIPATVYLSEIVNPDYRSFLATWTSIFMSFGILFVYILGYFIQENWRIIAFITVSISSGTFFLLLAAMPESPQWLTRQYRFKEAEKSLARIWCIDVKTPCVREQIFSLVDQRKRTILERLRRSFSAPILPKKSAYLVKANCIKPFFIMTTYFFFQQFSGTFVVVFYVITIVHESGMENDNYVVAILVGLSRFVGSFLVGPFCNRFGRRIPSIFSGIVITVCMILLTIYEWGKFSGFIPKEFIVKTQWIPAILLIIFLFGSTLGFMAIPFAMMGEVFPVKVRGLLGGLCTCLCFIFNFITVKTYPKMKETMQIHGVYAFYGSVALIGTIFIIFALPETKGKTMQEIEEYFTGAPVIQEQPSYENVASFPTL